MNDEAHWRAMAIDYGAKRVGVALTDPTRTISYPYETWTNDPSLLSKIAELVEREDVRVVALGYPLKVDGSPTDATKLVETFKKKLEKATGVEVVLRDERYTSSEAKRRILQSVPGRMKRRDKALVDRNAAAIILEEFMAERFG